MHKICTRLLALAAVVASGSVAVAADMGMPTKAPVSPAPPAWTWTGFYIGGNVGYSASDGRQSSNASLFSSAGVLDMFTDYSLAPSGVIGGVQVGYNWQFAPQWVVGIEWDWNWTDQKDSACGIAGMTCAGGSSINGFSSLDEKLSWVSTLRGRLGWAQEGWLFYVTGGGAWAKVDTNLSFNCPSGCGTLGGATAATASFGDTKSGWSLGGGIEVRLIGNWTGRVEYLHVDVGSVSQTLIGAPTATSVTINDKVRDNIFRAALNYKFDWARGW